MRINEIDLDRIDDPKQNYAQGLEEELWRGRWLVFLSFMWLGSYFTHAWYLAGTLYVMMCLVGIGLWCYYGSSSYFWKRRSLFLLGAFLAFAWGGMRTKSYDEKLTSTLIEWRSVGIQSLSREILKGEVHTLKRRGSKWTALLALSPLENTEHPTLKAIMALYQTENLAPEITVGAQVWLTPSQRLGFSLSEVLATPDELGFDLRDYVWRNHAVVWACGDLWLAQEGSSFHRSLHKARQSLIHRFNQSHEGGLVAMAIGLGDANLLSDERRVQIRRLGLAHLFAVSGLHVGGMALFLGWIARLFAIFLGSMRPGRIALIVAMSGAWLLTIAVGCPLSALRAAVMVSALCSARLLCLHVTPLGALTVAGYALTVLSPWVAQELSFQLSWSAVLGLCVMTPQLKLPFATAFVASLSASLSTAPILAWSLSTYTPLAPVTNLLITPIASLTALPLCLVGSSSVIILSLLGVERLGWFGQMLLDMGALSAQWGGELLLVGVDLLPQVLEWEVIVGRAGALSLLLILLLWWQMSRNWDARLSIRQDKMSTEQIYHIWKGVITLQRGRSSMLIIGGALLSLQLLWVNLRSESPSVTVLSVGQGDATLLLNGNGKAALFDVGPRSGGRVIRETLMKRGMKRLEWIGISHLHPDHFEGLFELLDQLKVGAVVYHGRMPEVRHAKRENALKEDAWSMLKKELNLLNIPLIQAQPTTQIWGKLILEWGLTHPTQDLKENDASLSLLIYPSQGQSPKRALLLSGDLESRGEQRLVKQWQSSESVYIWQADHHGSNTSTKSHTLAYLKPRISLMSLGAHNRYAFPHPEVLARLYEQGVSWLRTDLEGHISTVWLPDGSIQILSGGKGLPRW